ncbi:hypothetical protein D3C79_627960 [compost metagenome]
MLLCKPLRQRFNFIVSFISSLVGSQQVLLADPVQHGRWLIERKLQLLKPSRHTEKTHGFLKLPVGHATRILMSVSFFDSLKVSSCHRLTRHHSHVIGNGVLPELQLLSSQRRQIELISQRLIELRHELVVMIHTKQRRDELCLLPGRLSRNP